MNLNTQDGSKSRACDQHIYRSKCKYKTKLRQKFYIKCMSYDKLCKNVKIIFNFFQKPSKEET